MKFFHHCTTLDELKATYKKLALENHPDRGGDTETMKAINVEYAYATAQLLNGQSFSQEKKEREMHFSEMYRDIMEKIIYLPGITIEVIGLWLWVTGDTRPVSKELKAAGLWYAAKKQAWYYRADEFKVLRGSNKSLDEIRARYGSQTVDREERRKIRG